jgi:hypothetical protein
MPASRPIGRRNTAETTAPATRATAGARKCGWSTLSFRSTSAATFTMRNTPTSRSTVVSDRSARSSTVKRSTSDSAVVTATATHGVFRDVSRLKAAGRTPRLDMPYSRREAISMLISIVLLTATIDTAEKISPAFNDGAPAFTTSSSGPLDAVSTSRGTVIAAVKATSR